MASSDPRLPVARRLGGMVSGSRLVRVLSYRDFRLLWIGAFISFTGSWVQNVAQGYFVYRLTGSEAALALVSFCSSVPVFLFAFLAGTMSDAFDKRKVLTIAMLCLSAASLFMSAATYFGFVRYWHIVCVALFVGLVGCVEMPTRQSIVSRVVPAEDLAAAVPVNAMTFNVARIFGPAIGGVILSTMGVPLCYLTNGITFIALIWAVRAIQADLTPHPREAQPIRDLLFEGMRYTMRDGRLKTLFFLETITAAAGLAYITLLPAFVEQVMGLGLEPAKKALGMAYTCVGIGALIGLLVITQLAHSEKKGTIIRAAMWTIGFGLITLSVARSPWVAYPVFGLVGMSTIAQFNTTNALFQMLSPERLRGRVLAMHIWALNGLSPFGILFFGWLAHTTRETGYFHVLSVDIKVANTGVSLALQVGGAMMLLGALGATLSRNGLSNLRPMKG
ncbi:MAG: MFS transporter [Fimbriimonas sp.]